MKSAIRLVALTVFIFSVQGFLPLHAQVAPYPPSEDNAAPTPSVQWSRDATFRLRVKLAPCEEGLHVHEVEAGGPATRMRLVDDTSITGTLETGDHITHVNHYLVRTVSELQTLLANSQGNAILTVKDVRSGRSNHYYVQAESTEPREPTTDSPNPRQPNRDPSQRVVALLVGLTSDRKLGEGIVLSMNNVTETLKSGLPAHELEVHRLEAQNCNAQTILATIDNLEIGPHDALFMCYFGHGAYDSRYAQNDPSGGHYFQITSGDLLRKSVTDRLLQKSAKLTVMVSDTCNVNAMTNNLFRFHAETRERYSPGLLQMRELFFCHSGFIDLSGSGRDEYGWYDSKTGGWFSHCFNHSLGGERTWDSLLQGTHRDAIEFYQTNRQAIIQNKRQLSETEQALHNQKSQTPTLFSYQINRDRNIPNSGETYFETRTIQVLSLEIPY